MIVSTSDRKIFSIRRVLNTLDRLLSSFDLRKDSFPLSEIINEPFGLIRLATDSNEVLHNRMRVNTVEFIGHRLGLNTRMRERVPNTQHRVVAARDEASRRGRSQRSRTQSPQFITVALNHAFDIMKVKVGLKILLLLIYTLRLSNTQC